MTLAKALGARTKRFLYVYDFGDNWEHEVLVEKIVAGNSGGERPLCSRGQAAPAAGGLRRCARLSKFP